MYFNFSKISRLSYMNYFGTVANYSAKRGVHTGDRRDYYGDRTVYPVIRGVYFHDRAVCTGDRDIYYGDSAIHFGDRRVYFDNRAIYYERREKFTGGERKSGKFNNFRFFPFHFYFLPLDSRAVAFFVFFAASAWAGVVGFDLWLFAFERG